MLYYSEKLITDCGPDSFYKTVTLTCGALVTMIITVNFLSDLIETDKIGSFFSLYGYTCY